MEDSERSLLAKSDEPSSVSIMNMKKVSYICGWCGKENEFHSREELNQYASKPLTSNALEYIRLIV